MKRIGVIKLPALLKDGSVDEALQIAKDLNRTKMEEFMDMALQFRDEDVARIAAEYGRAEGKAEGMKELLISVLQNFPEMLKETPQAIAAKFGIDIQLVKAVVAV